MIFAMLLVWLLGAGTYFFYFRAKPYKNGRDSNIRYSSILFLLSIVVIVVWCAYRGWL